MKDINRIAVFTSGGDAPGMNAAIRSVVRTGAFHDLHVYGIRRGYQGMIEGDFQRLERRSVGNIIHRGGTILKTARSMEFMTKEGRKSAYESLIANDIDACIAIGGNGTLTGAKVFTEEYPDIPFIGIPGTIDNDLFGTDLTIGFDTSVNTAIDAVDKIRDTADSHDRLFFVEVMGRNSGFIALHTGIGGGAGYVLVPETDTTTKEIVDAIQLGAKRKKLFSVIIIAEGNKSGSAQEVAAAVKKELPNFDMRVTIIGHLQRGGSPTALDRVLASRLGNCAVEALLDGKNRVMVGIKNNQITYTPFEEAITKERELNQELIRLAEILSQ